MPKQILTLDSMGDLDSGAMRIAVNQALKLIAQDLADRPALEKTRKVTVILEFKPVVDINSQAPHLESVNSAWQVLSRIPSIGSAATSMKPQQDGQLYFHSDIPESPDDETVMDEAERRRIEREQRREQGDS